MKFTPDHTDIEGLKLFEVLERSESVTNFLSEDHPLFVRKKDLFSDYFDHLESSSVNLSKEIKESLLAFLFEVNEHQLALIEEAKSIEASVNEGTAPTARSADIGICKRGCQQNLDFCKRTTVGSDDQCYLQYYSCLRRCDYAVSGSSLGVALFYPSTRLRGDPLLLRGPRVLKALPKSFGNKIHSFKSDRRLKITFYELPGLKGNWQEYGHRPDGRRDIQHNKLNGLVGSIKIDRAPHL